MGIGRGDFVAKFGYLIRRHCSIIVSVKEEQRAVKIRRMRDRRGLLKKLRDVGDQRLQARNERGMGVSHKSGECGALACSCFACLVD